MAITTPAVARARRASTFSRRELRWGLFFLAPWLLGFLLFFLVPMALSFGYSFTNYNLLSPEPPRFVGLANWRQLFVDPAVRQSLGVTVRFLAVAVPVGLILPLLFAVLVNSRRLRGKQIFQTLFYLPTMVPLVAGAMIWRGVLNQQSGWVNRILEWLGAPAPGPAWLSDAHLAVPTLTLVGIWGVGGAMLVMLAGLQGIPTELYDAARVDGAGPLRSFITITLPLLSPVLFYQLVLTTIGALQEFLRALVIYSESTGAGPDNAALFYMVNLYREAFVYFKMGYASALAWGLFLVALLITIALFAGARRYVYYASER